MMVYICKKCGKRTDEFGWIAWDGCPACGNKTYLKKDGEV